MNARAIVRADEILSGRWHFEGTTIPIAMIVTDSAYGQSEVKEQYRFMDLTDEEIAVALAFVFPTIRPVEVTVQYASLTVNCECGEATSKAATGPAIESIACPCRRVWHLRLASDLAGAIDGD
jgi:uncharacterized protein (DUF433 family)